MARTPIEIPIASETKAFRQGVESGIIAPLDDAEKALTDLGKSKGPDQLEKSMKDAQRQTEKLGTETKQVADKIEREFKEAYRGVDRAADDLGGVKAATQEVTQEIGQNLGEAVSSVRGDLSDLGQVGQDTLGGLAATLASAGPAGVAGVAALAAGAVGLGLVTAEMEKQQEQAEKLRERLSAAYTEAAEAGRTYIDVATVAADAMDLANNPDRAEEWERVLQTQKETGLELSTILQANAGDLEKIAVVMHAVDAANKAAIDSGAEANVFIDTFGTELQQLGDYWNTLGDEAEDANQRSAASLDAVDQLLRTQIASASEATKEVDELGNELYSLPNGEQILIDVETGKATQNISKFRGDLDGVPEVVTSTVRVNVDDSAWRNWKPGDKVGNVRTANGKGSGGITWQ